MNNHDEHSTTTRNTVFRILSFVIFLVVLAVVILKVYRILSLKETSGDYMSSTAQLYATEEGLMDVVFVGTSHVYTGIYPAVLWEKYGCSAFDMAISGEDINSSYHTIVELLKTQSPAVVCVDLFGILYDEYVLEGNLHRNMLAMNTSANAYQLLSDVLEKEKIKDYLFRFPVIHTRYKELKKYDFISDPNNEYARGEVVYNYCRPLGVDALNASQTSDVGELSNANREWIDSLILLSLEENFELVLCVTPFEITYEQQKIINSAIQYAMERGVECIDCNKLIGEIGIDLSNDFQDSGHLNCWGAYKLTSWIGEWLNERIDYNDHRGDYRYYQWENNARAYDNRMDSYQMLESADLEEILPIMTRNSDFYLVASIDFVYYEQFEDYYEVFDLMGIDHEEAYNGGMWIYSDSGWKKVLNNDATLPPYYEYLTDSDVLRLHYDAFLSPTNIAVGKDNYNNYGYNVTVLVYDRFLEKVVYSGGQ